MSSFEEFKLMLHNYKFDVVALSETWLKNNPLLIEHVAIENFEIEYNNRDKIRGGGVGGAM